MTGTIEYQEQRAIVNNTIITMATPDAVAIRNLSEGAIRYHGLRIGDSVTFETVQVTKTITDVKEHRYGFDGQYKKVGSDKKVVVLKSETLKLCKGEPSKNYRYGISETSKKGWWWK